MKLPARSILKRVSLASGADDAPEQAVAALFAGATSRLADAAFPHHRLWRVKPDVRMVRLEEGGAAESFYSTFRVAAADRPLPTLSPEILDAQEGGGRWVYVDSLERVRTYLGRSGATALRFLAPAGQLASATSIAAAAPGWSVWTFARSNFSKPSLVGLVPGGAEERDEACADWTISFRKQQARVRLPASPARRDQKLVLRPPHLIIDGDAYVEGDASYHWMWIGSAPILRIALGCLPDTCSRIVVNFAPTPLHRELLENICFQINGRGVAHRGERPYDDAGRATIEVAPSQRREGLILGIGCRLRNREPNTGRILSANLESIEVTGE